MLYRRSTVSHRYGFPNRVSGRLITFVFLATWGCENATYCSGSFFEKISCELNAVMCDGNRLWVSNAIGIWSYRAFLDSYRCESSMMAKDLLGIELVENGFSFRWAIGWPTIVHTCHLNWPFRSISKTSLTVSGLLLFKVSLYSNCCWAKRSNSAKYSPSKRTASWAVWLSCGCVSMSFETWSIALLQHTFFVKPHNDSAFEFTLLVLIQWH